tara:strand:+ start:1289 stop:1717 length:429 start_codon:yes stop_codon:yes gene_type:complete
MFLLNNIKVNEREQRTIGDTQYPSGWFLDPLERAKVGMTEEPTPSVPDDNLFTWVVNADGSYTTTPRTPSDTAEIAFLRVLELAQTVREKRNKLLADTDWVVLRAKELGQPVPLDVYTYRGDLRQLPEQAGFPATITWPEEI